MAEQRVGLERKSSEQEEAVSVRDYIESAARQIPPRLVWIEPDPNAVELGNDSGRRITNLPLARGGPANWPAEWSGLPLAEARLFWEKAALHVVAVEGGCRWARIEEQANGDLERAESRVYPRQDLRRYGLTAGGLAEKLTAIEYRERGRLVGWRLTIDSKEDGNG